MIRYAISDRRMLAKHERERRAVLVEQVMYLARIGVQFFQVREKDLTESELVALTREIVAVSGLMHVLVNGSVDAALQSAVDGVHLPQAMANLAVPEGLMVSVSCHSMEEVVAAVERRADVILFGPVFGKTVVGEEVMPGVGLDALREACAMAAGIPVLALGGVTMEDASLCMEAGAAGVAGIRMFLR